MEFTPESVAGLPEGGDHFEWDPSLPSFGVRVRGKWVCCAREKASDTRRRHYSTTGGRNHGPARRAVLLSHFRLAINAQAGEIHPFLGHRRQGERV